MEILGMEIIQLQLIMKKFKKIKLINDKNRFDDNQLNSTL